MPKRVHSVADELWFENRVRNAPSAALSNPIVTRGLVESLQKRSCFASHENKLRENIPLQSVDVILRVQPLCLAQGGSPKGFVRAGGGCGLYSYEKSISIVEAAFAKDVPETLSIRVDTYLRRHTMVTLCRHLSRICC